MSSVSFIYVTYIRQLRHIITSVNHLLKHRSGLFVGELWHSCAHLHTFFILLHYLLPRHLYTFEYDFHKPSLINYGNY